MRCIQFVQPDHTIGLVFGLESHDAADVNIRVATLNELRNRTSIPFAWLPRERGSLKSGAYPISTPGITLLGEALDPSTTHGLHIIVKNSKYHQGIITI